jgi:hypothetical protein
MNLPGLIWNTNMLIYSILCGVCTPSRWKESSVSAYLGTELSIVATKVCAEQPSSSNSHIETLKRQLATSQYHVNSINRESFIPLLSIRSDRF